MSKILFTDKQVRKLYKNEWIENITNKGITYTDKFKEKVVMEMLNNNKLAREVFEECGIDPGIIGDNRIWSSTYRWKRQYKEKGKLYDNRKGNSGRNYKDGTKRRKYNQEGQ